MYTRNCYSRNFRVCIFIIVLWRLLASSISLRICGDRTLARYRIRNISTYVHFHKWCSSFLLSSVFLSFLDRYRSNEYKSIIFHMNKKAYRMQTRYHSLPSYSLFIRRSNGTGFIFILPRNTFRNVDEYFNRNLSPLLSLPLEKSASIYRLRSSGGRGEEDEKNEGRTARDHLADSNCQLTVL